jgi:bifunctional non-homologous end joining protein LigD
MAAEQVTEGGITVELTHPDKVLFPESGITKAGLVGYYRAVAGRMLPLLADRPVTLMRYPDGITGHRIVQKNAPDYFPDWITRVAAPKQGGSVSYVLCDKPATLAYLANSAAIELHVFLSRTGALEDPDQVVFDLDPPAGAGFGDVTRAARLLRGLLEDDLGLTAFVKTTGGKGLHVHVPLDGSADFDAARGFARDAAQVVADREPGLLTAEQRKDKRGGLIYADAQRNAYGQTAVAPYSVRGRPGAAVATPLHWAELDDPDLTPADFTLATVPGRLAAQDGAADGDGDGDPWAGLPRRRYKLARARERLAQITAA